MVAPTHVHPFLKFFRWNRHPIKREQRQTLGNRQNGFENTPFRLHTRGATNFWCFWPTINAKTLNNNRLTYKRTVGPLLPQNVRRERRSHLLHADTLPIYTCIFSRLDFTHKVNLRIKVIFWTTIFKWIMEIQWVANPQPSITRNEEDLFWVTREILLFCMNYSLNENILYLRNNEHTFFQRHQLFGEFLMTRRVRVSIW